MIAAPCIILGGTVALVAVWLLAEDEVFRPAAGSRARGRSAAKRSAEASGGAPISTGSPFGATPAKRTCVMASVSNWVKKRLRALTSRVTTCSQLQSSDDASGQVPAGCYLLTSRSMELGKRNNPGASQIADVPVNQKREPISAGEKFAHDAQVQLFQHVLDGILTEAEYNAYAERIRSGKHLRARCVTGSWLDRRAS